MLVEKNRKGKGGPSIINQLPDYKRRMRTPVCKVHDIGGASIRENGRLHWDLWPVPEMRVWYSAIEPNDSHTYSSFLLQDPWNICQKRSRRISSLAFDIAMSEVKDFGRIRKKNWLQNYSYPRPEVDDFSCRTHAACHHASHGPKICAEYVMSPYLCSVGMPHKMTFPGRHSA